MVALELSTKTHKKVQIQFCSFFNLGARWEMLVNAKLRPFYSQQRPDTHCIEGFVGHRAVLEGRKISFPPGFDPRTVQPVASRYTDWSTRPKFVHGSFS